MKSKGVINILLSMFLSFINKGAIGQHHRFTQYYKTPSYLNPAFTGTSHLMKNLYENTSDDKILKFNLGARAQFISGGVLGKYNTSYFNLDWNFNNSNGLGIYFLGNELDFDNKSTAKIRNFQAGISFSNQFKLAKDLFPNGRTESSRQFSFCSMGFSVNWSKWFLENNQLYYRDQFTSNGPILPTMDYPIESQYFNKNNFHVNAGVSYVQRNDLTAGVALTYRGETKDYYYWRLHSNIPIWKNTNLSKSVYFKTLYMTELKNSKFVAQELTPGIEYRHKFAKSMIDFSFLGRLNPQQKFDAGCLILGLTGNILQGNFSIDYIPNPILYAKSSFSYELTISAWIKKKDSKYCNVVKYYFDP